MKNFFKKIVDVIKNNLVKTTLIVVLNVCFVALCLGISSYAWIIAKANLSTITVDSGSLEVSTIEVTAYKYVFGTSGSLTDYTTGTVTSYALSSGAIEMNRFDPVSIYIQNPTDAEIKTMSSKMNSNVVLEVKVTLASDCDFTLKLDAVKNSNTNPDTTTYTDGIADYITFCGADSSDTNFSNITNSTLDKTTTEYKTLVFDTVKAYGEGTSATLSSFHSGDNIVTTASVVSGLSKNKGDTVTLYLNIDYSYDYVKKYANEDLYNPKKFYMNYGFNVRADQRFQ